MGSSSKQTGKGVNIQKLSESSGTLRSDYSDEDHKEKKKPNNKKKLDIAKAALPGNQKVVRLPTTLDGRTMKQIVEQSEHSESKDMTDDSMRTDREEQDEIPSKGGRTHSAKNLDLNDEERQIKENFKNHPKKQKSLRPKIDAMNILSNVLGGENSYMDIESNVLQPNTSDASQHIEYKRGPGEELDQNMVKMINILSKKQLEEMQEMARSLKKIMEERQDLFNIQLQMMMRNSSNQTVE